VIEFGAVLAGLATAAAATWVVRPSRIATRVETIALAAQATVGSSLSVRHRALGAAGGRAAMGAALAVLCIVAGVPLLAPAFGYVAFIAPSIVADHRRGRDRRSAERALGLAIEWTDALVTVGQPAERAFAAAARQGTGDRLLDPILREACGAAALGAPLFRALALGARGAGLPQLGQLADELDRARDLGRGTRSVVRDARDELRRRERAVAISAAAKVDAKLMLVLVGCYLPALMLIVVVPLFVGLLGGLLE